MKEPDINEFLKILSAVIDHGSFSKAASELEISQVTVSKKISELEDFIGEALIERTSKGIRPLPGALKLHISYKTSLNRLGVFLSGLKNDINKYQGPVKLAVPSILGYFALSAYLPQFLRENSQIKLAITFTDNPVSLINDDFDLVIAERQPKWQNARYKHLYTVSNGIYANERYIQLNSVQKKVRGGHSQRYASINSVNFQTDSNLSIVSPTNNQDIKLGLPIFRGTSFYGSLPDIFSDETLREYGLKRINDDMRLVNKSYYLIRNSDYLTPAVQKVIEFIDDCIYRIIHLKHYQYPSAKERLHQTEDIFDELA